MRTSLTDAKIAIAGVDDRSELSFRSQTDRWNRFPREEALGKCLDSSDGWLNGWLTWAQPQSLHVLDRSKIKAKAGVLGISPWPSSFFWRLVTRQCSDRTEIFQDNGTCNPCKERCPMSKFLISGQIAATSGGVYMVYFDSTPTFNLFSAPYSLS